MYLITNSMDKKSISSWKIKTMYDRENQWKKKNRKKENILLYK